MNVNLTGKELHILLIKYGNTKKFIQAQTKKYIQEKKIMSIRCKVCNSSKISNKNIVNSTVSWECQNCGNVLDANGFVVTVE